VSITDKTGAGLDAEITVKSVGKPPEPPKPPVPDDLIVSIPDIGFDVMLIDGVVKIVTINGFKEGDELELMWTVLKNAGFEKINHYSPLPLTSFIGTGVYNERNGKLVWAFVFTEDVAPGSSILEIEPVGRGILRMRENFGAFKARVAVNRNNPIRDPNMCNECGTNPAFCERCGWCKDCDEEFWKVQHCGICDWGKDCLKYTGTEWCDYCDNCEECCPCIFCEYCGEHESVCECIFCEECGEHEDYCVCCHKCHKKICVCPPRLLGDVNDSGDIDIGDVLEILKYLADLPSVIDDDEEAFEFALITGEEVPTIGDALEILKYLAGLPSLLKQ